MNILITYCIIIYQCKIKLWYCFIIFIAKLILECYIHAIWVCTNDGGIAEMTLGMK